MCWFPEKISLQPILGLDDLEYPPEKTEQFKFITIFQELVEGKNMPKRETKLIPHTLYHLVSMNVHPPSIHTVHLRSSLKYGKLEPSVVQFKNSGF
jgi:hypothetical protein